MVTLNLNETIERSLLKIHFSYLITEYFTSVCTLPVDVAAFLLVIFSYISRLTVRIRHFILPLLISFLNLSSELIRQISVKEKVKDCLDHLVFIYNVTISTINI